MFNRLEAHSSAMPLHVWHIATTLQWHVPTQRYVISERTVASKLPDLPETISVVGKDGQLEELSVLQTNSYQRTILKMAQKIQGMNEKGFFNLFGSVTVKSDAKVLLALANVFQEEVDLIKDELDLGINIVYNPLTHNALRQMRQNGGNALDLKEDDGPLTGMIDSSCRKTSLILSVVNINLRWSDENSEARMRQFIRSLIHRFSESARKMDMLHPYIFQNHAFEEEDVFEEQDVFAGCGDEKLSSLRKVRELVDPNGVFQKLQPGYFKLEPRIKEESLPKSEH